MIKKVFQIGKYTWETSNQKLLGEGAYAQVFECKDYPGIVMMKFRTVYKAKRDWLDFLDLILGESVYGEEYILILPKMDTVSSLPSWFQSEGLTEIEMDYDNWNPEKTEQYIAWINGADDPDVSLGSLLEKGVPKMYKPLFEKKDWQYFERKDWRLTTENTMQLFRFVKQHKDKFDFDPNVFAWIDQFDRFFAKYPQWENDSNFFDFGDANLLRHNGKLIISDAIA